MDEPEKKAPGNADAKAQPDAPASPKPAPAKLLQGGPKGSGPAQPATAKPKPDAGQGAGGYTPHEFQAAPANPAYMRRRHWGLVFSFLIFVVVPILGAGWYLYERAADQYASTVGFSIRKEESTSSIELLAGIDSLGSSSSTDADILYEFIQSQKLVQDIQSQVDLVTIWSLEYDNDPIFSYDADGTIEDLLDHWDRKVRIFYDSGTGLIEIQTLAFRPEDALRINEAIFEESSKMINSLTAIARADSIGYARTELEAAEERLRSARAAITDFRNRNQIVDPTADLQNQTGLMGNLEAQLAEALIDVDLLAETTQPNDPRISQAELRVRVIQDRIAEERRKLGIGDDTDADSAFADLVGEYERLLVDRQFAESTYTAALSSYDVAQAEARRQSRYLAAHVSPTLAERAEYPRREILLLTISVFVFVIWAIAAMVYYSLKDRR